MTRTLKTALLIFFTCIGISVALHGADMRPNIILMFADDQPQRCLGFMGNDSIKTPNIDALARRGIVFKNAFVSTAICFSSRASMLTGQHQYRHGILDFKTPLSAEAFEQTYPALLRKSGYRTGFLGKYAIGQPALGQSELSLPAKKFDFWYGFPQSIDFRQEVNGKTRFLTEVMTEKAIDFLKSATPDQPFCLTVAFKEPHGPFNYFDPKVPNIYENVELPASPTFTNEDFQAQPEFIRSSLNADGSQSKLASKDRYQADLRTFYRTVTRADQAVGEILAELRRLKLDDNTVVIYTSDHGSLLGDHGLFGKWLMYENSIRVPLILFDPRVDPKLGTGQRDEMALGIDLAPTLLAIASIQPPPAMQGMDLMPVVHKNNPRWRSHFYYEHTYQTDPPRSPISESEGIRTTKWKYIRYPKTTGPFEQLFNLETDPLERVNSVHQAEHATILQELRKLCDARGET